MERRFLQQRFENMVLYAVIVISNLMIMSDAFCLRPPPSSQPRVSLPYHHHILYQKAALQVVSTAMEDYCDIRQMNDQHEEDPDTIKKADNIFPDIVVEKTLLSETTADFKERSVGQGAVPSSIILDNIERHRDAVRQAENLFYGFNFTAQEWQSQQDRIVPWEKQSFPGISSPSSSTTMSLSSATTAVDAMPPVPFGMNDLLAVSQEPLLSKEECDMIIEEAETTGKYFGWAQGGARYGTPANRVGALLPLEELSRSYTMVNFELLPRLFSNISKKLFPNVVPDPSSLRLGGARVIRYDANAGQVELGYHRDGLLLTANIALNGEEEYTGGGTVIPALNGKSFRLPCGHALCHPGDILHAGAPITSGKRYVLVLFILDTTIIPHDRYCAERGERDMALARHLQDQEEKDKLLASAATHFSYALACGARIDQPNHDQGTTEKDLDAEYQQLLRRAARHFGAKRVMK